ncbi:MAG: hypothetical protein HPZ79_05540 [Oscillospiraceae bacterium]|nr:hypothetical protein [Oscillospiraceae bacterium]
MKRRALTLLLAVVLGYGSFDVIAAHLPVQLGYVTEGGVSEELRAYMDTYMAAIPPDAARLLADGGWRIVLTSEELATHFGYDYDTIAGVTVESARTIFISASKTRIRRALLHEVGHALGILLGDPDASAEFQRIYEAERETFDQQEKIDDHCISSGHEYFAEAYRHYVLYPDILLQSAPQTYSYFQALLPTLS